MFPTENARGPGPEPLRIPRRDPGLVAIPALGLASLVLVLIRPALIALPLAAASILAGLAYTRCLEARAVRVSPLLLGGIIGLVVVVAVVRPALYLVSIVGALFAAGVWAMSKLRQGGTSDSLFATFLGVALLGLAPSHLGLTAVSPFAGGESMGKALAVVTLSVSTAAIAIASLAARSIEARSAGAPVAGGRLGADLAGLLAAVFVSLVASTVKKPQASALDYLLLAAAIAAAVALGRQLAATFVTGGSDPAEIVAPSSIGEVYSLRIMLPASLAFMASYYVGKLAFT